jgi:hypothetical protein
MPADWSSVYEDRKPGEGEIPQDIREKYPDIFSKPAGYLLEKKETAPTAAPTAPGAPPRTAPAAVPGATAPAPSAAPAPDTTDYAKLGPLEVAGKAFQALPSSAVKTAGDLGYAATHLPEVGGAILNLGQGALSKTAGMFGAKQDPAEKARTEAGLNALFQDYGTRYGSWEGFAKAASTDPVGILMDIGTFVPMAGAGFKAAGLPKVAKALEATKYLDPITATAAGINAAATPAIGASKLALGLSTGTGKTALDWVQDAARSGDAERLKNLREFASGTGDPKKAVTSAMGAVSDAKIAATETFKADKSGLGQKVLPTDKIEDAIDRARAEIGATWDPTTGRWKTKYKPYQLELKAIDDAENMLINQGDFTPAAMHELKVAINQHFNALGVFDRRAKAGALGEIPAAVKETINDVAPKYQDMMDFWTDHLDQLKNFSSALGSSSRSGSMAQFAKLMKEMKKGKGAPLIHTLAQFPSGKYLKDMLAGQAIHEWFPDWFKQAGPLLQTAGGITLGSGAALGMLPHAITTALASSPKMMGSAIYGIGAAQRYGRQATDLLRRGPGLAGATLGEMLQEENPIIKTEPTPVESAGGSIFSSGRIGRQSGGRVGNPGFAADKLIAAAEKAKNRHSDDTSPLLDMPDEAITKALAIANEKI